jgi:YVTN family beta-propeller protein
MAMGLSVLVVVGVSNSKAGSKPLKNEVIDVISGLNSPDGVIVSPDGKYVYVAEAGNNTLAVIDATTHEIYDNAIYAGSSPNDVALTPNGRTLYVSNDGGVLGFGANDLIQTQSLSGASINFGMAVSPNGKTLYVAEVTGDQIGVFDTAGAGKFVKNIAVGHAPSDVVVTPNGKTAYVTNEDDNTVSVIDVKTGAVTGSPITGFNEPVGINITPDGQTVYVDNLTTVSVIDTKTNTVVGSPIDLSAYGALDLLMAVTPDGKYLYVPMENSPKGELIVISTATNTVVTPAPAALLGPSPQAVAISPNGKFAYVTDNSNGTLTIISISGD